MIAKPLFSAPQPRILRLDLPGFRLWRWALPLLAAAWTAAGPGPARAAETRPVVVEEFTGTWCGYCYAAGMALDRIEKARPRSEVIILAFHAGDSYSIPYSNTRANYYAIGGYPTSWFNGLVKSAGGYPVSSGENGIAAMLAGYNQVIQGEESRTAGSIPFSIDLSGSPGPDNPSFTAKITSATGYVGTVTARFFITEDDIPVNASNGQTVLNSVVRAHLGSQDFSLPAAGSTTLTASLPGTIPFLKAENLHPVVLVQDSATKEILGAVGEFSNLPPPAGSDLAWSLYE